MAEEILALRRVEDFLRQEQVKLHTCYRSKGSTFYEHTGNRAEVIRQSIFRDCTLVCAEFYVFIAGWVRRHGAVSTAQHTLHESAGISQKCDALVFRLYFPGELDQQIVRISRLSQRAFNRYPGKWPHVACQQALQFCNPCFVPTLFDHRTIARRQLRR